MNRQQIKAVLKVEDRFAITPTPVNQPVPGVYIRAAKQNVRDCPTGLIEARLVEPNVEWEEQFTFGCGGDRTYSATRRNGVLVEFERPEGMGVKALKACPHAKRVKADGRDLVQLVVDAKALVAPWGEYELEMARRQKASADRDARQARLGAAVEALGGDLGRSGYYREWDRDEQGERGRERLQGHVDLPLEVAEQLIERLAAAA